MLIELRSHTGTTKCHRCPTALTKLNAMSSETAFDNVIFVSVCLDNKEKAIALIEERCVCQETKLSYRANVDRSGWTEMTHFCADLETKEKAKAHWGFKFVPHVVAVGRDGSTVFNGSSACATKGELCTALHGSDNTHSVGLCLVEDF